MKLNSKYTWAWVLWLLAFGVIEWKAINNKSSGDTLSEHVWKLIGTKADKKSAAHWTFRAGLVAFLAWLIPHFFTAGV